MSGKRELHAIGFARIGDFLLEMGLTEDDFGAILPMVRIDTGGTPTSKWIPAFAFVALSKSAQALLDLHAADVFVHKRPNEPRPAPRLVTPLGDPIPPGRVG